MKALITGASGGIGRDMARYLVSLGHSVIAVGRNEKKLEDLKKELGENNCETIQCDVSVRENVFSLYEKTKNENIDILINNAGFGAFGDFETVPLEKELELIDTNITALHILTKLFYIDFMKKNSGYILNVASSAGFMAGPLLSSYYASKNYVLQLTKAVYEETRRKKKNVSLSAFCPGPVDTGFNDRANVRFAMKGISSSFAAKYAIDNMFKKKVIIVPTAKMKLGTFGLRFISAKTALKIAYHIQKKKDS